MNLNTPTPDEIDEIVVVGVSFGNQETGEEVENPTIAQVRDQALIPDVDQIIEVLTEAKIAMAANDWETAHGRISTVFVHLNEVTGPAIRDAHQAVDEYSQRKESVGTITVPDAIDDVIARMFGGLRP